MPVTEEQVLAALKQVRDPELHRDVVSLGMVRNVKVDGERVELELVLTTPACPFNEQMRQMAYEAVASLPGVREVVLHVSAEVPKGVPERTPLPGRAQHRRRREWERRCRQDDRRRELGGGVSPFGGSGRLAGR